MAWSWFAAVFLLTYYLVTGDYIVDTYKINEVRIDVPVSINEIQSAIKDLLDRDKSLISFINPEIFLWAEKDKRLREYLSHTVYNFVDGIGLLTAINKVYRDKKYLITDRYAGTDFFTYLSEDILWRVFLFGASYENNKLASRLIPRKYKNAKIVGSVDGYTKYSDNEIIQKINQCSPDILIVCLGVPRQEQWIEKNADKLNAKIIFGNGGSIDFWSGSVKRAPKFFIIHKMEWLYRLFQDFNLNRIKRQAKLVFFAINILFNRYDIKRQTIF